MPNALHAFLSSSRPYLTDGGLETTLIFHDGFDLPLFAAFVLYDTPEGRAALVRYFTRYLDVADADGRGFLLDTATWRANAGWGPKLGVSDVGLRKAEARHAELTKEYNNGAPERNALDLRNTQRYAERTAEIKANLARSESDIAGIKRELARLPSP